MKRISAVLVAGFLLMAGCSESEAPEPVVRVEVPRACREAIDAAREYGSISVQFAMTMQKWPDIAADSYEAGVYRKPVRPILQRIRRVTAQVERLTAAIDMDTFDAAADECEEFPETG